MCRARNLVVIGIDSHYGRRLLQGIYDYCRNHGIWDFHVAGNSNPEALEEVRDIVRQEKVDGIIVPIRSPRIARIMKSLQAPIVNVSNNLPHLGPSVFSDCAAVGHMGARYLLDNGFRSFGIITHSFSHCLCKRQEGFLAELTGTGHSCRVFMDSSAIPIAASRIKIRRQIEHWIATIRQPLALFCDYDSRAPEIYRICQRMGRRIPDDVALLSAGDQEICQMFTPTLSSIDLNIEQIGFEAARLMHCLIEGAAPPKKPILIPPAKVVARQSTDVVAIADPDISAAVRYIRDHIQDHINTKDLLRQLPISRKTLERRFQKLLGHSPSAEILRVRMERAKRLLSDSDLPIKTVAKDSGFLNLNTFDLFFRNSASQTPTQFRMESRRGRMRSLEATNHSRR